MATSESWKDRNTGERKEKTEWHNVSIFNEPLGKIAEQYLRKGSKVYLEGRLETRKWQDQSGNDRYTTEVVLRPFSSTLVLLDRPSGDGGNRRDDRGTGDDDYGPGGGGFGYGGGGGSGGRPKPAAFDNDLDDDVPF